MESGLGQQVSSDFVFGGFNNDEVLIQDSRFANVRMVEYIPWNFEVTAL